MYVYSSLKFSSFSFASLPCHSSRIIFSSFASGINSALVSNKPSFVTPCAVLGMPSSTSHASGRSLFNPIIFIFSVILLSRRVIPTSVMAFNPASSLSHHKVTSLLIRCLKLVLKTALDPPDQLTHT